MGKELDTGTVYTIKEDGWVSLTLSFQLTVDKKAMDAGLMSMTSNVKSRLEVKTKKSGCSLGLRMRDTDPECRGDT